MKKLLVIKIFEDFRTYKTIIRLQFLNWFVIAEWRVDNMTGKIE